MIPSQLVNVPFDGGINEKSSEKYLVAGSEMKLAQNVVFTKNHVISKRLGFAPLAKTNVLGGSSLAAGAKLVPYKNEVAVIDGTQMWSYSSTRGGWSPVAYVPTCAATRLSIAQSSASLKDMDVAEGSGYRVFVWWDASAIMASVTDVSTGAVLHTQIAIPSATNTVRPKVMVIGTVAIIVAELAASTSLYAATLDMAASSTWSVSLLKNDKIASPVFGGWDVCPVAGGTTWVLAYENSAIAPSIALVTYNTSLVVQATGTVTGETHTGMLNMAVRATSGEQLWIAYSYASGGSAKLTLAAANPSTLVQTLGPTAVGSYTFTPYQVGLERIDATHVGLVFSFQDANSTTQLNAFKYNTSGTSLGFSLSYHTDIISRPFAHAGRVYAWLFYPGGHGFAVNSDGTQSTMFLVDLMLDVVDPGFQTYIRPVATVAPRFTNTVGTGARSAGSLSSATNVGNTSATSYVVASLVVEGAGVKGKVGVTSVTADFASLGLWTSAELGEATYLACGTPSAYDGSGISEVGFLAPPNVQATSSSTVGGGLANQKYTYAVVYEWSDARGQKYQSAPTLKAIDLTGSGTSTNQVTFTLTLLPVTSKGYQVGTAGNPNPVSIIVYRTAYVGGTMSTIQYRVTPDVSGNTTYFTELISIVDLGTGAAADATITSNPYLYTTGNVVESDCPPSFTMLCAHKNRIWGVGDDQRTVWFSTAYVQGQPVRFTDLFTFSVDDGGPITALGSLDDVLVIFKRDRIYIVAGEGPPTTGAGTDLTVPRKLASDVGCIDPRSVVLTPMGLMFQSPSGIYILTRALQVEWLGKPALDTLAAYPVCTSAVMLGDQGVVIFTLTNTAGTLGLMLVYDYVQNAWSTWVVNDSDFYGLGAPCVSAVNVNGTYYALTSKGQVLQQKSTASSSAYRDGSNWVTMTAQTAWFEPAGLQGFQRIRRAHVLADETEPYDLTVTLDFDYAPGSYGHQVASFANSAVARNGSNQQMTVHVANQKCESMRVQISDAAPTGGASAPLGLGPTLNGIALEVAAKTGGFKNIPASNRA